MKRIATYFFIGLLLAVSVASCSRKNELPSLKETFSPKDKAPFGTYVANDLLSQLFYNNDIKIKKTSFQKTFETTDDTASFYICITKRLFINEKELDAMLSFVNKGNDMFISSEYFDTAFLNSLNLPAKQPYNFFEPLLNRMKYTAVKLSPAYYADSSLFSYYYMPMDHSFNAVKQTESVKILGTNEDDEPNYVAVFYGKGRFYLHCEPRAFSNYFLLQQNNYQYLQEALSFVQMVPEHVFLDDYYNKRNSSPSDDGNRSGFSVLLKYPAMARAFWLAVLLLLLYIVFGSKRRQRIIKPLVANENTSVAFTETVSRLYLQKKDNRNMADKMITYFFEHLRNQYFLNTNQVTDEFIGTLSRKSSVPKEQVEKLFSSINKIQQSAELGDQELLSLNHQIEKFYKHNQ